MFLRAILFAATFAVLTGASPNRARLALAASNCTRDSFRIPSWYIQDFHAKSDGVTFEVLNRATNYTADVECHGPTRSSSCFVKSTRNRTSLHVSLERRSNTTVNLALSETWLCGTGNATLPIVFIATGNTSLALDCAGSQGWNVTCGSTDPLVLVKGSLQSPLTIDPAYATGTLGHDSPGCSAEKDAPSWELRGVYYLNTTGDGGATSLPAQSLMLQIFNEAIGFQAGCLVFLDNNLSSEPVTFTCNGGADRTGKNRYTVTTQGYFEPATFLFSVNQTWYCDEADPARPVSVLGTGSVKMGLNCTSDLVPSGTDSSPYNITSCYADSVIVNGTVLSRTDLPAYSIEDPLPTPDGCTVSSILSPAWRFSNFEVEKNSTADAGAMATIGFNIQLETQAHFFDFPVTVLQNGVRLNQTAGTNSTTVAPAWYPCAFGQSEHPNAPHQCSFQYDGATRKFSVRAEWICDDLDPDHPVVFTGTATTTVPELTCKDSGSNTSLTRCRSADGFSWLATISNVTKRQAEPVAVDPTPANE